MQDLKLPANFPAQESLPARAIVFAIAAALPLLMHAKDKYHQPLPGGWLLLGVVELGLLAAIALLLRAGAKGEKRYDGLTFELPFAFELFFGGIGAVILGASLYAASIMGAFDLSYDAPKPTSLSPVGVAAATFFLLVGALLMLIRPVFLLNEAGARLLLFGTGLSLFVLDIPRSKLTVVAIEKPLIDNTRRITGVAIHIRGKAGLLTFSLPRDSGIPRVLGQHEIAQKDAVVAQWQARLKGG